ncbi:MAG: hypothetical protein IPK68_05620 [Bdellovibrionales bacterium]|jgi:hypothetical protein|nr:hypothetical protein [Bdellovibrionales bacterium]
MSQQNKNIKPEDYLPQKQSESDALVPISLRVPSKLKAEFEKALKKMEFNQTDFLRGQMQWLVDYAKASKSK